MVSISFPAVFPERFFGCYGIFLRDQFIYNKRSIRARFGSLFLTDRKDFLTCFHNIQAPGIFFRYGAQLRKYRSCITLAAFRNHNRLRIFAFDRITDNCPVINTGNAGICDHSV